MDDVINRNLCDSCINNGCIFQSGIVRNHCDFYKTERLTEQQDTPTVTYVFGKWIEKEDDGYHGGGYTECSVCGQRYSWGGYFEANGFRYCPRCGHRMEVEEDE